MTDDTPPDPSPGQVAGGVRIPPLATARAACRYVFRRPGLFLNCAGIWLLVFGGLYCIRYAFSSNPSESWVLLLEEGLLVVAEARIAVLWCRAVLLGKAVSGLRALRVGWREAEFLQLVIPVLLLGGFVKNSITATLGETGPLGMIAAGSVLADFLPLTAQLVGFVVLYLVLGRFVPGLPMAALDRLGGALRASWHLTRGGNGRRLAGGLAALLVPFEGLMWSIEYASLALAEDDQLSLLSFGGELLWLIVDFAEVAVCMAFASYAYALLTETAPRQPA